MKNVNESEQINTSKRKSKEQLRKEKRLNRSLIYVSKSVQNETGLMAIQMEDGVFFLGNGKYMKIYSIKAPSLAEKKAAFVKAMLELTNNRIRISTFYKKRNEKASAYSFVSIYYEAFNYAEASVVIRDFEKDMEDKVCRPLNILISNCSVETSLTFLHMNCAGEMKQYSHEILTSKKSDWKTEVFPAVSDACVGNFIYQDKCGICFSGKLFGDKQVSINDALMKLSGNIQIVVDFQKMTETEQGMFEYEMGRKYNCSLENYKKDVINATYLVSAFSENQEQQKMLRLQIMELFDKNRVLLMPCAGNESKVFSSICSLGIVDYHSMRNVNRDVISSLLW